nr:hypothetical protein [Tanacetum cinerariifolium]
KYALTVNPNIYVSCIKQFWTTIAVKQVNYVTRLQALVNKKKVVITEATIRDALRLDDAKDSTTKFYMYPRFLQLIIRKQVGDLSTHTTKYTSPALTQKGDEEGDADEHVEEVNTGDAVEGDDSAAHGEGPTRIETSDATMMDDESNQGRMIAKMDQDDAVVVKDDKEVVDAVKDAEEAKVDESAQVQGRQAEYQAKIYKIDMDHTNKVLSMQEDETKPSEVQEVVDVVTTAKLITKVVTAASETVIVTSAIITTAEAQVPAATTATLTGAPVRVVVAPKEPKHRKKKQHIDQDEQFARKLHAELNKDIDWDEAIDHVKLKAKEDPSVKGYQSMKRKPQTETQARKNMMMYLKNVVGFKLDYFNIMSYDDIRPIFEAKFNSNVDFLLKKKEQIEKEENRALQTINKAPAKKAAKRRTLNEEDDAVVVKDDKEVVDAVKDAEEAKVDESAQVQGRQAEYQAKIYKIDMDHTNKVLSMQEDETKPSEVQEVVDVVTTAKLITKVVTAASETVIVTSAIITTAEAQVPAATTATLTGAPVRVVVAPSKRR